MIILTGPSASGKTATCLYLQEHYGIKKVITHTTREMRAGEVNDIDYHFVSKDTFNAMKKEDAFIETVSFDDNYYGTSRKEVKIDKCLAVEFNGAKTYSSLKDPRIVIFYMKANESLRLKRMEGRGDDPKKILTRINNDHKAFDMDEDIDSVIDFTVDTEKYDIAAAADLIYHKYIEILKERNIDFPKNGEDVA